MREILFRGKRIDNGEWVEGCFGRHTSLDAFIIDRPYPAMSGELSALGFYEVDPATVGQFTGLHDKNDKKVFEGDVMEFDAYGLHYSGCVFIVNGNASVICKVGSPFLDDTINRNGAVCIGNIHDNPELLEG